MRKETADILALLDSFKLFRADDTARKIANDFRQRRIEKGITRARIAEQSGVAIGNVARFEQKGLISLINLIKLAHALGYVADVGNIFSAPKFSTMEELQQIRRNTGKKKARTRPENETDEK